jgi:hypothetical protein
MSKRKYHFQLPYEIGSFYVGFGISQLKHEGLFQKLPKGLQSRFQQAADNWSSLVVTKADCDSIDDHTWAAIATKLGLEWSK